MLLAKQQQKKETPVKKSIKTKMLFVTATVPDLPSDGIKIVSYHLIRQLQQLYDYSIDLVVLSQEGVAFDLTQIEPFCRSIQIFKIRKQSRLSKVLNLFRITPNQVLMRYDQNIFRTFQKYIAGKDYDFIYAMPIGMWKYIEANHNVVRVLNTLDAHSLRESRQLWEEPLYSYKKYYALLNWLKMQWYEKTKYPAADACILVSAHDKAYLQNRGNQSRLEVIQNGVDAAFYQASKVKAKSEPLSLLFTGDYHYRPNELAALYLYKKIYLALKKNYLSLKLYVVGKNPTAGMKKVITHKDAVLTGFVNDVRPYLKTAAVFVCPLQYGSGMKNKILEAMCMQIPVVCSEHSICGLEDLQTKGLVAVVPKKADYLEPVKQLLDDHNQRQVLGEQGRTYVVERYSWQKNAQETHQLVNSLLSARKP